MRSKRFKHTGWASGLQRGKTVVSMKYNINYLCLLKKKMNSSFLLVEKTRRWRPNKRIFCTEHRHKHQATSDVHQHTLALLVQDICSFNLCARSAVMQWEVLETQSVFGLLWLESEVVHTVLRLQTFTHQQISDSPTCWLFNVRLNNREPTWLEMNPVFHGWTAWTLVFVCNGSL